MVMDYSSEDEEEEWDPLADNYAYGGGNNRLRVMTDEERSEYLHQVRESEGFDIGEFPGTRINGRIFLIPGLADGCPAILMKSAVMGIQDFNQKNGTNYEVVEIEKANTQASYGALYYITCKVQPAFTPADYPTTSFQVLSLNSPKGTFIKLCNPKP